MIYISKISQYDNSIEEKEEFSIYLEKKLKLLETKIQENQIQECNEIIRDFTDKYFNNHPIKNRIDYLFKIVNYLWIYEKIDQMVNLLIKIEKILNNVNLDAIKCYSNEELNQKIAILNFMKGCSHAINSNFRNAESLFKKSLEICTDQHLKAIILNNIGSVMELLEKSDESITYYRKSLDVFKKLDDSMAVSILYNNLTTLNIEARDFDNGMVLGRHASEIQKELPNNIVLILIYNNLGQIYRVWGENDTASVYYGKALDFYHEIQKKKSEIDMKIKNYEWILLPWYFNIINFKNTIKYQSSLILFRLALIQQSQGNFNKAFDFLKKSYEMDEIFGFDNKKAQTLFQLVYLLTENKDLEESFPYFERLQELYVNSSQNIGINYISYYFLLSKALILRGKENIKAFAESLDILEELHTQKERISFNLTRYTLLFLMEAYLKELQLFDNKKIFRKANLLVSEIEKLAWQEKSNQFLVHTKYIKAKLALIQSKFKKAKELLEIGYTIAKNKNLWVYAGNIYGELKKLENIGETWNDSNFKNLTISERIRLSNLDVAITNVSQNKFDQLTQFPDFVLENIKIALFKMGDEGPLPVLSEELDFGDKNNDILHKLALFYIMVLGQGNSPNFGFYGPLPIPDIPSHIALAYTFTIGDRQIMDPRMRKGTFAILSFIMPESFVQFFTNRDDITQKIKQRLLNFKDIHNIDLQILRSIKLYFLEK